MGEEKERLNSLKVRWLTSDGEVEIFIRGDTNLQEVYETFIKVVKFLWSNGRIKHPDDYTYS